MSVRRTAFVVTALLLPALVILAVPPVPAEGPPVNDTKIEESEKTGVLNRDEQVLAALEKRGKWVFRDQALRDVVQSMAKETGIDIVIDRKALEECGIGTDTPVTLNINGIRARSFLNHMLHELDLTWVVGDGALWITTPEAAESRPRVHVYPVGDLIRVGDAGDESDYDYDGLIETIKSTITPDTWDDVGGPGAVEGIYGALVVSQVRPVHEELQRFLAAYREVVEGHHKHPRAVQNAAAGGDSADDKVRAALARRISLDVMDTTLAETADQLAQQCDVPVLLDTKALEDHGIGTDLPLTANIVDLPLRIALRRVLHDSELTWIVRDEALVITTPEEAESWVHALFYPVYDLVTVAADAVDESGYEFDSLIEAIKSTVAPESWDDVGGPGAVKPIVNPPTLVIAQTEDVHEQLADLRAGLRKAKEAEGQLRAGGANDAKPAPRRVRIQAYLLKVDQQGKPLFPAEQVIGLLHKVVLPKGWDSEPDVLMEPVGNTVVIRHTEQVHRQVQRLLSGIGAWSPWGGGPDQTQTATGVPGGGGFGGMGGGFF